MGKTQVLFIDDDPSLQLLATALLNSGSFEVISASRTAQAENLLKTRTVDIIVCDVMMPEEDGLTFCKRIKDRGDRTPFLFLSAASDRASIQQGLDAGATDYLVKPFDIHELQKKLLAMLGKYVPRPGTTKKDKKSSGPLGWFKS